MCEHTTVHKHGFTRNGGQRFKCSECGQTFVKQPDNAEHHDGRRISKDKQGQIKQLLSDGKSYREIQAIVGGCRSSIGRIKGRQNVVTSRRRNVGENDCDYCGKPISGKREFNRRTRRTKHKFCSHDCYSDFYRCIRAKDKCKLCSRRRDSFRFPFFRLGYCNGCYWLMHKYGFDSKKVELHVLTKQLKKEARYAKRRSDQHVRPQKNAN